MGEGDIPREYIEEKEKINKNAIRHMGYSVIGSVMLVLAMAYPFGRWLNSESKKLKKLREKPIHQEYIENKISLNYLRDELKRFAPEIPDSVSEKTKKELESITESYENSFMINRLEKAINSKKADSVIIANSDEFKDYISKEKEITRRINKLPWFFFIPPALSVYLGVRISEARRKRKLKAIKAEYNIEN